MDANSRAALDTFNRAKRMKAKGIGIEVAPPRIRLAAHIDLSAAKPSCKRCHGTGISGVSVAGHATPDGLREEARIPIVCLCVRRGGGVKADRLDRMHEPRNSWQRLKRWALLWLAGLVLWWRER